MPKPLQLLTFEAPQQKKWRQLTSAHQEFQRILRLLLDYDERNEQQQEHPELHHLRRSLSVAKTEDICIYLRDMGGYLFHIVAKLNTLGGEAVTAWLHEDGIQAERELRKNEAEHPVHKLLCMSDLMRRHSKIIKLNESIGESVLKLMIDE